MYIKFGILAFGAFILASCAHHPAKTCSAVISHSQTEYDVCTGAGAQAGDRVTFFKEKCRTPYRGSPKKCSKEKVGEASILRVLDEDLSTVKLDSAFEVTESMTVETKRNRP